MQDDRSLRKKGQEKVRIMAFFAGRDFWNWGAERVLCGEGFLREAGVIWGGEGESSVRGRRVFCGRRE